MGTWGAGNFHEDSALDWLGLEVQGPLVATIERELRDHDEANGALIMAAVEVLAMICENTPVLPPDPRKVEDWRRRYMATWGKYIDELDPKPGFKEERLRVIDATFNRLATVAHARYR